MNALFATTASSIVTLVIIAIHIISFVMMLAILFEFRHIHCKRVALLRALESSIVRRELLERKLLMSIYTFATVALILLSTSVLFMSNPSS